MRSGESSGIALALRRPELRSGQPSRTVGEFEAMLPQLIDAEVAARFEELTAALRGRIEDTHIKTIETFADRIQENLIRRIGSLETNFQRQAEAMRELGEYSKRTENNLLRLSSAIENWRPGGE